MPERLLTTAEVAERIQRRPEWVREQAKLRRIPAIRLGRHYRFRPSAIEAWLRDQETAQPPTRTQLIRRAAGAAIADVYGIPRARRQRRKNR
ncbi:MAG: helix-turn-helix domain-containing protein [Candidatus Tectomicrobia bacterium]|uniref:Helix-turn-helix domain-containing protein n=1 Tax=Tectimicrobiota bacterium TaxID=2528274 RepID=A0A932HXU9_UNCTE|nr:helix-turn-helix domain-containing protein [Candidatus Tectomicrobia bacterium]